MIKTKRIAVAVLGSLLALALAGAPAQAKQVYDYTYSGDFIDGTGSEKGTFPYFNLAGIAYDATTENVLVAVAADPGYVARFDTAGVPSPFNPPALGETIVLPAAQGSESRVAVDDSGGPDSGNVYLASAGGGSSKIAGFAPDGTPLAGFEQFKQGLCGIDVSPQGEIWASFSNGLHRYGPDGNEIGSLQNGSSICDVVRDAAGSFYVVSSTGKAIKLDSNGQYLYDLSQSTKANGFSIDTSNSDVFALEGNTVSYYDSVGAKLGSFGAPDPAHSFSGLANNPVGIAVDPVSHDVWVANHRDYGSGVGHVERFVRSAPITVPTAITGSQQYAGATSTLQASLDPDGIETSDCHFDWGTTQILAKEAPCAEGDVFTGFGPVSVSAPLSGLHKGTTYYYRLSSKNANERVSTGGVKQFIAQDKPLLLSAYADQVNTDGVRLKATIDPNGGNTTYRFQYGTSEAYGSETPASGPFGLLESKSFANVITGLAAGTTYHYRLVATNEAGTTVGDDHAFTTYAPESGGDPCPNANVRQQTSAALLFDCRAYELASAPNAGGFDVESSLVPGQEPLVTSPTAPGKLLYSVHSGSVPGVAGNPTNYGRDPYLATRTAAGWQTEYVGLPADGMAQNGAFGSPLLESDSGLGRFAFGGEGICSPCFADGSTNIPLRTAGGTMIQKGIAGSLNPGDADASGYVAKYFSGDGSHLIFGTTSKLEPLGKNGLTTIYERDLSSGATQVVSTLPNGAAMGAGNAAELDVSENGSRVVVATKVSTDSAGNDYHHLYLHQGTNPKSIDLTPATTSGVLYDGMSENGTRIFFTTKDQLLSAKDSDQSADIYEAEVDEAGVPQLRLVSVKQSGPSNDDSCEPPGIPDSWNAAEGDGKCGAVAFAGGAGVASASGTFYFLSPELLGGATEGEADEANLYVLEPGAAAPRFVATMDSSAGKPAPEEGLSLIDTLGPFSRPAEVQDRPWKPLHVAVDDSGAASDGSVYVADDTAGTVRKFDSAGDPVTSWGVNGVMNGSTAPEGPFGDAGSPESAIIGIAVGPSGDLVLYRRALEAEKKSEAQGLERKFDIAPDGTPISTVKSLNLSDSFKGIAVDGASYFYYAIGGGRVVKQAADGSSYTSPPPYTGAVAQGGVEVAGMAIDRSDGALYVGRRNGVVEVFRFDAEGKVLQPGGGTCAPEWFGIGGGVGGCPPTEVRAEGLVNLRAIAVNSLDHHLFADLGNQIVELDESGAQVGSSFGLGVLDHSNSIAVADATGKVYATTVEGDHGAVKVFDRVPLSWRPIDNPAILHAVGDAGERRSSDFQLSPDGRYAAFGSAEPLEHDFSNLGHEEIYRYDVQEDELDCASCSLTGAAPASDTSLSAYGRNLTGDGRLFFTSSEPFVLRDTNQRSDAYEWKGGKIQLISSGQSPEGDALLSASEDGVDVFFFTRETLASGDENGAAVRIYNAREGGGFARRIGTFPCAASDECHGAGSQAPGAPATNTVTGAGKRSGAPQTKPRCRKGKVRRAGKCRNKRRAHRNRHQHHARGGVR